MYEVRIAITLIVCFFVLPTPVFAQVTPDSYCALQVELEDFDGNPTIGEVTVRTDAGDLLGVALIQKGEVARFCDVGYEIFRVTVGERFCGETSVKHLQVYHPRVLRLRIRYRYCHLQFHPTLRCDVLLRFHDADNKPVHGVRVENTQWGSSDALGRIFAYLPARTKFEGIALHGAEKLPIALACDLPKAYEAKYSVKQR